MRIGYYVSEFPYKNPVSGELTRQYIGGGVGIAAYNLALEMVRRGYDASVFTSSIDSKDSFEQFDSTRVYRYGKNFTIGIAPISLKLLYKPLNHDVDVVHAHLGNLPAPLTAYRYAKKKKKPFVITFHGNPTVSFGDPIRRMAVFLSLCLIDKLLSSADVIIALSEVFVSESRFLSKYRDKIEIIPNGINLDDFSIPYSKEETRMKLGFSDDEHIILFVGTLMQHKNPHILLEAMPIIKKFVPNVRLIFVGRGPMLGRLKRLTQKMGINSNVNFTGFLWNKKFLYYKASDVFVLPSSSEAFPMVLLEASAMGLPLVVSNLGAFRYIVEGGYNGLFTKTGDKKDLADKIIYLLEKKRIRERIGRNARQKVKEFSWKIVGEETQKIYLRLIENGKQT